MSVAVCVILVANALVNSAAATDSWTKSEFPNSQLDVDDCSNNGSKSSVCDPTRLLTRQDDAHHVTLRTWMRPVHFPSTWETRCGSLETATTKVASQIDVSPWLRTESCVRKKLSDWSVRMVVNKTSDIFKDRRFGTGLTYIPKQYLEVQSGKQDCVARSVGTTPGVVFGIFGVVVGVIIVYVFIYLCCCDHGGDVNSSNHTGGHRLETANRTSGNYLGSAHHSNGTGDVVVFVGGGGCGSGLGGDGGVGFEDGGCGGGFDSGGGGGCDSGGGGGGGCDSGGGGGCGEF